MPVYNIGLQNDMGHVSFLDMDYYKKYPKHIQNFAWQKVDAYVESYAELTPEGFYIRLYRLKPGMQKKWTYYCGNDTVNIDYTPLCY